MHKWKATNQGHTTSLLGITEEVRSNEDRALSILEGYPSQENTLLPK
jgi:hypothetical protein